MNGIEKAICFITSAFEGQTRKGSSCPAVFHSLEVGYIAETLTDDESIILAALLHDVAEDAGVDTEELAIRFGKRAAELVSAESEKRVDNEDMRASWLERKRGAIETVKTTKDRGVKIIFLADKLSNLRSLYRAKLELGEHAFDMFHQNDPKMQLWYYRSIAEALTELDGTAAYKEYSELIIKIFGEYME